MSDEISTKITLEINYPDSTYKHSVSVDRWDLTIGEFFDTLIFPLALSAGYHPDSVSEYLGEGN